MRDLDEMSDFFDDSTCSEPRVSTVRTAEPFGTILADLTICPFLGRRLSHWSSRNLIPQPALGLTDRPIPRPGRRGERRCGGRAPGSRAGPSETNGGRPPSGRPSGGAPRGKSRFVEACDDGFMG